MPWKDDRENDPEKYNRQIDEWRKSNPEKVRAYARKAAKKWRQNNPVKLKEQKAWYRAKKKRATPNWVDRKAIREIYDNCPAGYHVDHIYPLAHPDCCGLHVPWNLQYLPAEENIRKRNSLP